jgi:hypothetical protein
MASTKHRNRPSALQSGTSVHGPGRVAYYRERNNRALTGHGYTAAKYQDEYHLAGPSGNQVAFRTPDKSYHRVILAEFLACLMLVVASIILVPAQTASEGAGDSTRSFAKELVQITAICIVFFVLALMASGAKTGKVASAFGGLVTLGVAWNASGVFSALAKAIGPAKAKTAAASSASAEPFYPTPTGQLAADQQLLGEG